MGCAWVAGRAIVKGLVNLFTVESEVAAKVAEHFSSIAHHLGFSPSDDIHQVPEQIPQLPRVGIRSSLGWVSM